MFYHYRMNQKSPHRLAAIEARWLEKEAAFAREHGCSREEYEIRRAEIRRMRNAYSRQKGNAKARGIGWEFDFEGWADFWMKSNKWALRGTRGYVMCRKRDEGPYSRENCYIGTFLDNRDDRVNYRKWPLDRIPK